MDLWDVISDLFPIRSCYIFYSIGIMFSRISFLGKLLFSMECFHCEKYCGWNFLICFLKSNFITFYFTTTNKCISSSSSGKNPQQFPQCTPLWKEETGIVYLSDWRKNSNITHRLFECYWVQFGDYFRLTEGTLLGSGFRFLWHIMYFYTPIIEVLLGAIYIVCCNICIVSEPIIFWTSWDIIIEILQKKIRSRAKPSTKGPDNSEKR